MNSSFDFILLLGDIFLLLQITLVKEESDGCFYHINVYQDEGPAFRTSTWTLTVLRVDHSLSA